MNERLSGYVVRYIALLVSVTAVLTGFTAIDQNHDLQNALIGACEANRGPVQTYFQEQLDESLSHNIGYYERRFPDFPEGELRELIGQSRANLRAVVGVYDPTTCEDTYR